MKRISKSTLFLRFFAFLLIHLILRYNLRHYILDKLYLLYNPFYNSIIFLKALNNSVKKLYFILQKKLSIPFERKYNEFMYGKEIVMERVVSILTFTFVSFAVFFNFNLLLTGQESSSLIPYSEFVVIFVHCVISVGTFINIFKFGISLESFIFLNISAYLFS